MNTSKYEQIPFGSLQGAINYATKSVLDTCEIMSVHIDEELDYCDCYYRFVNECSPQSDEPEELLKIERVVCNGKDIKLTDWQMQTAAETILWSIYKVRA